MFFLLRACLWIGAVILLVPMLPSMRSTEPPVSQGSAQGVSQVWHAPTTGSAPPAATSVATASGPTLPGAADVVSFCLENGAVCEAGFSVVSALGDAVGQGLELAAELQHGDAPAAATAPSEVYDPPPIAVATVPVRVSALPAAAVGTLTAADRAAPWLGDTATAAVEAVLPAAAGFTAPRLPLPSPRRRPAG